MKAKFLMTAAVALILGGSTAQAGEDPPMGFFVTSVGMGDGANLGGLEGAEYVWGGDHSPKGKPAANTWQGEFPWQNLIEDGFEGTSPVSSFPPNGFGLYDMAGNVWEWTADWWAEAHPSEAEKPCCMPTNPRGGNVEQSYDPAGPQWKIPRKTVKGGSYLCAPNYCLRYRPAARRPQMTDTGTSHIGFRCNLRQDPAE